jgi:23S rRNA pseudouridine955/2504/2580 synthase
MKQTSTGRAGARSSGRAIARAGKSAIKAESAKQGMKPAAQQKVDRAKAEALKAKKARKAAAAEAALAPSSPAKPATAKPPAAKRAPAKPPQQTRNSVKAAAEAVLQTGIQTLTVTADEADMRLDRFLGARFPQIAFTHIQRIVRTGQLRVDGARVKPNDRLVEGQSIRVPPLKMAEHAPRSPRGADDLAFLKSITLYEDADVLVINKPAGLAVQGGSGTTRHVDGILDCMRDASGQKPRLVHRLDKDTAGCLVIAKSRFAASVLAKSFRSRTTRKVYWAICAGVPRVRQGRISAYLVKEAQEDGDARMVVANHGDEGADHALTYYAVVDQSAQKLSWLSLKPVTGRTHQLRAHTAHIGHPIIGDPKYFNVENWDLPGGIQNRLHLLARRIIVPHPRTGRPLDITAPLPPHMQQTFNLLGLETDRYDPIVDAPED